MTNIKLSARAEKLLVRVKEGSFYLPYSPKLPAAMKELENAGLVTLTGRVQSVILAYVPTSGYIPFQNERFEE